MDNLELIVHKSWQPLAESFKVGEFHMNAGNIEFEAFIENRVSRNVKVLNLGSAFEVLLYQLCKYVAGRMVDDCLDPFLSFSSYIHNLGFSIL